MIPQSYTALRGTKPAPFLVVDPGKRCGLARYRPREMAFVGGLGAWTCSLDGLPDELRDIVHADGVSYVVCESFSLLGGNRLNDPSIPASQGIGMVRMACYTAGVPLYMVPPKDKSAGHLSMDTATGAAYARCHNDHERDVIDIAALIKREWRMKP